MSFAEAAHEVDRHPLQSTPDSGFLNRVHDLRALFLHLEDHVPRGQYLPPNERALILGDYDDSKRMIEAFFLLALSRTERKLGANETWAAHIKKEHMNLLQGLAHYAQAAHASESSSVFKEIAPLTELTRICEHTLRFCDALGAKPAEMVSALPDATNDPIPLVL